MNLTAHFFGHLTYILVGLSYTARNIFWLRVMATVASIAGIFFGFLADENPIWVVIFWNVVFLAINGYQIARELRLGNLLSSHSDSNLLFSALDPMDKAHIAQLTEWGEFMTFQNAMMGLVEGEAADHIYLVLDGQAAIWKENEYLADCGQGVFLGDVSYFSGKPSSATVIFSKDSRVVRWETKLLKENLAKTPELDSAFTKHMAADLTRKMIRGESQCLASKREMEASCRLPSLTNL
ncbi:MAG: cyclic nucleotide-binding domain-containing protein [Planctomycetota bacterium]